MDKQEEGHKGANKNLKWGSGIKGGSYEMAGPGPSASLGLPTSWCSVLSVT